MGRVREIGAAFVRLFVRKDEFDSSLKQAEQTFQQSTARMDQDAQGVSRSIGGIGDSIRNATRGARDFTSALTSTTRIVTGLLGVFGLVAGAITSIVALIRSKNRAMVEAEERAQAFYRAFQQAEQSVKGTREAVDDLLSATLGFEQGPEVEIGRAFDRQRQAIRGQISALIEEMRKELNDPNIGILSTPADPGIASRIEQYRTLVDELNQEIRRLNEQEQAATNRAIRLMYEKNDAMRDQFQLQQRIDELQSEGNDFEAKRLQLAETANAQLRQAVELFGEGSTQGQAAIARIFQTFEQNLNRLNQRQDEEAQEARDRQEEIRQAELKRIRDVEQAQLDAIRREEQARARMIDDLRRAFGIDSVASGPITQAAATLDALATQNKVRAMGGNPL